MSPRSAKQFDDIRKQKKELIMETALKLFAENGYHTTSISQIAKKAGISKGLIYNYFESKKEILGEILKERFETIYSNFDINHDGVLSADEFKFFIRQNFVEIRKNPHYWKLYYSLTLQPSVTESFIHDYSDFSKQVINMMYQFVSSYGSKNPEMDVIAISSLIKGASLMLVSSPSFWHTENFDDHIIETCFKIINNKQS